MSKLWELLEVGEDESEFGIVMARRNFPAAPVAEFGEVSREMARLATSAPEEPARKAVRDYIHSIGPEKQQALAKRWFIQMSKGPSWRPQ